MKNINKTFILLTVLVFILGGCKLFKQENEKLNIKNTVGEVETRKEITEEKNVETEREKTSKEEIESEKETIDEKNAKKIESKDEMAYEKIPNEEIDTFKGIPINFENSYKVIFRDDNLTIVNKKFRLDPKYRPKNIVNIDKKYTVYGYAQLEGQAYRAFLKMRKAAEEEGLDLRISTGYRDYDFQKQLYTGYLAKDSQEDVDKLSARPGHSEHQLGTAADFSSGKNNLEKFTGTPEQLWMTKNAHKFGFILRYLEGKEKITGYSAESWHYRYVGDIAEEIHNSGKTLEEYLGME